MGSINLQEDIKPLSEFRANTASLVKQVKKTGRPIVLTQHGKSTVVLLDVGHYQSMLSSIELFNDSNCAPIQNLNSTGLNPCLNPGLNLKC
ncbi:MAG: type II toxin-antitoxin system Phd/YefM family antitoxin [Chlorobiaceae bacterium]|nr:type II toxin-antitoxin system Phd/YefM family antitoxin [Chlorobiaceae bacterium]